MINRFLAGLALALFMSTTFASGDLREDTATQIAIGPMLDATDGVTPETALTVTNFDCGIVKHATSSMAETSITITASGGSNDMAHLANGMYSLELTATDTNTAGRLVVWCEDSANTLGAWTELNVLDALAWDAAYADDAQQVHVVEYTAGVIDSTAVGTLSGADLGAPTNWADMAIVATTGEVGINLDDTQGTLDAAEIGADAITAAKIAADAIGASEAGFLTDSTGFQGADVATILVDTGTTLDTKINDIQGGTFSSVTDSLEAIRDRGDAAWTTGSGTGLTSIATGTAQAATATTLQLASGETFADDELIGAIAHITGGTTGVGQTKCITDYTGSTDTATVTTWTTTPTGTITYEIVPGAGDLCEPDVWDDAARTLTAATNITDTGNAVDLDANDRVVVNLDNALNTLSDAQIDEIQVAVNSMTAAGAQDFFTVDSTETSATAAEGSVVKEAADGVTGAGLTAISSGTAQSATATTLVLASGETFADDELIGALIHITGGTLGVGQTNCITDYTGSTDTATVDTWVTTPTGTITYEIVPNLGQSCPIQAAAGAGALNVTASGNIGIDWANVENPGSTVDLAATDIQLVDTVTTYTGNTVQTGDSFARLGAPAGASVSADIATVDTNVDSILADTGTDGVLVSSGTGTGQIDLTSGQVKSNVIQLGSSSQSLTDLKDFADAGYDPVNNRVLSVLSVTNNVRANWVVDNQTEAGASGNIEGVTSQTELDLDIGSSTNDVFNDKAYLYVFDQSDGNKLSCVELITDWVGATQTATLASACPITVTTSDTVAIMMDPSLDQIGVAGAGLTEAGGTGDQLTAIPWNAAWDAEVESEVDDSVGTDGQAAREGEGYVLCTVDSTNGAPTTTTMICDLTTPHGGASVTAENDLYIGKKIEMRTSSAAPPRIGDYAWISDSVWSGANSELTLTIDPALPAAPASGDTFLISPH